MTMVRPLTLFFTLSLSLASQATETLPFPDKAPPATPLTAEALQIEVTSLNSYIGTYPTAIKTQEEQEAVYQRWSNALRNAWEIEAKDPASESTLGLLADLYRQGHNFDVKTTGHNAIETTERCLTAYPDSIRCNFTAAYLYLSLNKRYAVRGETALLHLRELLKPQVNAEVERGMIFAYLHQGKQEGTLKQIDYYLTLVPDAEWAKTLREGIKDGRLVVHSE